MHPKCIVVCILNANTYKSIFTSLYMLTKEELKKTLRIQRKSLLEREKILKREVLEEIETDVPFVTVISGIRRCGKSTLLKEMILQNQKFYYINLEDPNLSKLEIGNLGLLEEALLEEFGKANYYYFDEIQNLEGWEIIIRYLLDNKKRVIITGSNASLLDKELGTKLTGRHLTYVLFPFSYKEFLKLKEEKGNKTNFLEYQQVGGMPEYLKIGNEKILQELFKDVISRDILIRHNIKNEKVINSLAIYLITNIGKEFSYNNLTKVFNIKSVNTTRSYIDYLEDSYLVFTLPKFNYSLKKQQVNQKKIYSIDNGLINSNSTSFSGDLGKLLENNIFLQLKRKHEQLFYFQKKGECDFLVKERNKITKAIQVCYNLSEENKKREINGLIEAMTEFNLNEGLILTYEQEDEIIVENKKILVKPAWKWMLE
jgi:uncharacterized protein